MGTPIRSMRDDIVPSGRVQENKLVVGCRVRQASSTEKLEKRSLNLSEVSRCVKSILDDERSRWRSKTALKSPNRKQSKLVLEKSSISSKKDLPNEISVRS